MIAIAFHGPVIHVRQLLPKTGIQRPECVEGFIADAGKQPSFHDEDPVFCFQFVFRLIEAGRDDNGAVVLRHSLIAVVDDRLIASGLFHRAFEVVVDKQLWHAAEEGQTATIGVQP